MSTSRVEAPAAPEATEQPPVVQGDGTILLAGLAAHEKSPDPTLGAPGLKPEDSHSGAPAPLARPDPRRCRR